MLTALTILHFVFALVLIILVLLQDSKGDASGLMGGGTNRSVFGAAGASSFLVKATRVIAACFAVSCLLLAYVTTSGNGKSVIDAVPATSLQRKAPETSPADDSVTPTPTDSTIIPVPENTDSTEK